MVKRPTKEGTKKPRKRGKTNRFPLIEKALGKRAKAELIEIVMKVTKSWEGATPGKHTLLAFSAFVRS